MTARERICARVLTGPASGWSWLGLEPECQKWWVRNAGLYECMMLLAVVGQADISDSAAVQAREEVENCCLTCWARQDRGVAG